MSRLRLFSIFLAVFAMIATLAACGGSSDSGTGGGDTGASSENPQTVLNQAFSADAAIKSADIDLSLDFAAKGSSEANFSASLTGPVEGGGGDVPKFDLTAKADGSGSGQNFNFEGGATSTGDAFYVSYGGNSYELDAATASYIKQAFQASSKQQTGQTGSLQAFKNVLTNLKNEGTTDVEGTETVEVSGDVDVKKLVDAIRPLAEQAQSLGTVAPGTSIPSPAELDQVTQLIKSATFDVYAGADDHVLRKLTATIDLDDPASSDTATIEFDLTLDKVNESLDVSAPDNAKPLSDLVGPGGLSGILGGAGLSGGSAGGSGGTAAAPTQEQLQCLQTAKTAADLSNCIGQ